jgi:hypothetical protein
MRSSAPLRSRAANNVLQGREGTHGKGEVGGTPPERDSALPFDHKLLQLSSAFTLTTTTLLIFAVTF